MIEPHSVPVRQAAWMVRKICRSMLAVVYDEPAMDLTPREGYTPRHNWVSCMIETVATDLSSDVG